MRGARSPMPGTSIISFASASCCSATPWRVLIASASAVGVRSAIAMSLVIWSPAIGITAVCRIAPCVKIARSVVPPPMSTRQTPRSRSSSVSTARADAIGCRIRSFDIQTAAAHALDDVLRRRYCAGDDMHLHLQAHAGHADGLAHVLLAVDDEFLAQHVQDLLVGRDVHRLRRLDGAFDVDRAHLAVLDRHHAGGVEAADVAAGDAGEGGGDLAVSHQFRLLERALDAGYRRFDVDHHALLEALGFVVAHAEHLERAVRSKFGDQRRHLGGADANRRRGCGSLSPFQPFQPATRSAKPFG